MKDYGSDSKSALQAKFDAQKIAFAPIMFQAARALRNLGILEFLVKNKRNGSRVKEISQKLNKVLENMIIKNPYQWIWTHNRWK